MHKHVCLVPGGVGCFVDTSSGGLVVICLFVDLITVVTLAAQFSWAFSLSTLVVYVTGMTEFFAVEILFDNNDITNNNQRDLINPWFIN